MGNNIQHCCELSSESLLIDIPGLPDCGFDVFIIDEPNLNDVGQFITMPLNFYDTIIKWSSKKHQNVDVKYTNWTIIGVEG